MEVRLRTWEAHESPRLQDKRNLSSHIHSAIKSGQRSLSNLCFSSTLTLTEIICLGYDAKKAY
jgi:hypothetical protein